LVVLNNLYELGATYLQVFLPWMLCSEPVLSFVCVYFVVSAHFMPFRGFSILRANLASIEKSAAGKIGLTFRDATFGEFVPRLGISATFGEKFEELRYLGIF